MSEPKREERFSVLTRRTTDIAGRPIATILALALVIVWAVLGPFMKFSDTWQLLINTPTTIVTFLMVFLLQNTQNRDTAAINSKLDEMLLAINDADNRDVGLEDRPEREVMQRREEKRAAAQRS